MVLWAGTILAGGKHPRAAWKWSVPHANDRRCRRQAVALAASRDRWTAGSRRPMRDPQIAIATSSSTMENARRVTAVKGADNRRGMLESPASHQRRTKTRGVLEGYDVLVMRTDGAAGTAATDARGAALPKAGVDGVVLLVVRTATSGVGAKAGRVDSTAVLTRGPVGPVSGVTGIRNMSRGGVNGSADP